MPLALAPDPVKRRHHHGDLRRSLVAAASVLLEEDGDEGVSVREVARRLGVSPRAPYRHFPTKEDLLTALAVEAFAELGRDLSEADAGAPAGREIEAQAVAYVAFAQAAPARFHLMFGPRSSDPAGPLAEVKKNAFAASVRRVLALREVDSEDEFRILGYWAFAHGLAQLSLDAHLGGGVGDVGRIARATLATRRDNTGDAKAATRSKRGPAAPGGRRRGGRTPSDD